MPDYFKAIAVDFDGTLTTGERPEPAVLTALGQHRSAVDADLVGDRGCGGEMVGMRGAGGITGLRFGGVAFKVAHRTDTTTTSGPRPTRQHAIVRPERSLPRSTRP